MKIRAVETPAVLAGALALLAGSALAQTAATQTPGQRAAAVNATLTPGERIEILHGAMALPFGPIKMPPHAIISAGYVPGVPRLGIPALEESDASLGVSYVNGLRHDGATALPSGLALAATFDPAIAYAGGAMIGHEAHSKGFNVLLAGGANLARDPRNGRNFEYLGEDPLLAGVLAGESIRGIQDQHVISTMKHFAVNDQETGRNYLNAVIDEAGARESDLLAFEIALEHGHPGAVMCGYNRVNGAYNCENAHLLNDVLKGDWGYPGFVMSDWGAVHSVDAAMKGLDQQSGEQLDPEIYFGAPLLAAAARDPAYKARVSNMTDRILHTMYTVGVIDHPPVVAPIDFAADGQVALQEAERGIVLLRNKDDLLPLLASAKRIAIIGGHADAGVISGAGSSQVAELGGPAVQIPMGGEGMMAPFRNVYFHGSSPQKAIAAHAPGAEIHYDDGSYPSAAADLARRSDVAVVFVTQWMIEGYDAADLSLPSGQDALVAAVAAANPHTIVVLETGGPVLMPWLDKVGAVIEAWYPGARGGEAIADVLFGQTDPSGRLPITFPADAGQLPRPEIVGAGRPEKAMYDVDYTEGSDVGYRWFAKKALKPLFPFGYGLSYTRFAYSDLKLEGGKTLTASVTVTNRGEREGVDTPQLYLTAKPGREQQRLLGWAQADLKPGESRRVSMTVDPRLLADWDTAAHGWMIQPGAYEAAIGESAQNLGSHLTANVSAQFLKP